MLHLVEVVTASTGAATPSADLFKWVVGAIIGGGGITGFLTYKIQRRKAPAEVDAIVVQSAETAVLAMQKVYEAEVESHARTRADRDRLQAENEKQRAEIRSLLVEIEGLRHRALALAASAGVDTDPNGLPTVGPGHSRG